MTEAAPGPGRRGEPVGLDGRGAGGLARGPRRRAVRDELTLELDDCLPFLVCRWAEGLLIDSRGFRQQLAEGECQVTPVGRFRVRSVDHSELIRAPFYGTM